MNWFEETYELIFTIINIYSLVTVLIALAISFTKKDYWQYFWSSNLAVFVVSLLSILIHNVFKIAILEEYGYPIVRSILIYNWCFITCMIVNYIIYLISLRNTKN